MVAFIASPLPDETLHSMLARTMRLQGCCLPRPFIRSFFGQHARSVSPLMTTGIAELVSKSCWDGVDTTEAMRRWTPLAYFRPFISAKSAEAMQRMLVERQQRREGHGGVGLSRGDTHWHKTLNFCPSCREGDLETEALPAWRRTHQLPGVFVCPDHLTPLRATDVTSLGSTNLKCCPLPDEHQGRVVEHCVDHALAVRLARASRWLLENPQQPRPPAVIQGAFRHLMAEKGFIGPNGMATPDFAGALLEWMAATGAATLVPNPASRSRSSMQRLWGRTGKLEASTLMAILLMEFLKTSPNAFFGICDCASVRTRSKSRRSAPEIHASTITRHRSTISALVRRLRHASRTRLRAASPTAWCFLLAHDRDWLETVAPPRRPNKAQRDWQKLDAALVQRAHQARDTLLAKLGMPQRLTFARLASAMGHRTILFRQDARLSGTLGIMRSAVETTEQLLRRRMDWALSGKAGRHPRTWSEFTSAIGLWRLPVTTELKNEALETFNRHIAAN